MALFTVTIGSFVNLPPSQIGDRTITLDYNETYTFTLNDFKNTVPPYVDPEGDDVDKVKIVTIPTQVDLLLNAVAVIANQEITAADINSNLLTYIADPLDTDGYTEIFTFDLSDVGSNTFSGLTPATVTINVGAEENQPPSEVGDGSATIDYAETLIFTAAMFTTGTTPVYADPEGDAPQDLKITTLPTLGQLLYNGSPVSINQIISLADVDLGLLTYIPDLADIDGDSQNFTFEVSDVGSGEFVA